MKNITKARYLFLFLLIIVGGCQKLELYRLGIGEKEDPIFEEQHRISCDQPSTDPLASDKCGRVIYRDGTKH